MKNPSATSATEPTYGIRFPLVKVAIEPRPRTGPRTEIVPDKTGLHGARACIAGMVTAAIHRRAVAEKALRAAARHEQFSDYRAANIARIEARNAREQMRSHALWARVFAQHINDNDPRLEEISARQMAKLSASFRAGIYSARWSRVQLMKIVAVLPPERRARIDALLQRIAAKHDALTPWGHTIAHRNAA